MSIRVPACDPIQEIPVARPDGCTLYFRVYRTDRPSGRRIIITDGFGEPLHSTDDAYDLGNAISSACDWLNANQSLIVA